MQPLFSSPTITLRQRRKKLQSLSFWDFAFCTEFMIPNWTLGIMDSWVDDMDVNLAEESLQDLKEIKLPSGESSMSSRRWKPDPGGWRMWPPSWPTIRISKTCLWTLWRSSWDRVAQTTGHWMINQYWALVHSLDDSRQPGPLGGLLGYPPTLLGCLLCLYHDWGLRHTLTIKWPWLWKKQDVLFLSMKLLNRGLLLSVFCNMMLFEFYTISYCFCNLEK